MYKKILIASFFILVCLSQANENQFRHVSYSANRMEIGEVFRFYENGKFGFMFSYGSLDLFAKGVWEQKNDSIFITTDSLGDDYLITLKKNKKIPKDKISLKFKIGPIHLSKQTYRVNENESFKYVEGYEKKDSSFVKIIDLKNKKLRLELNHKIFHLVKNPYIFEAELKKGVNEVEIQIAPAIRILNFKNELFLIDGNSLKLSKDSKQKVFNDVYTTDVDESEMLFKIN